MALPLQIMFLGDYIMKDHIELQNQIWIALDSRSFGGIESHVLSLAKALQSAGLDPKIIFIQDHREHPLEEMLKYADIKYMKCPSIWAYYRAIEKTRPLLIHAHGYKANIVSRIASKLYAVPLITSFHAGDAETWKMKLYTLMDRYSAFLNHSIAVNTAIQKQVTGHCITLPNFVELPEEKRVITEIKNIGFVGRLSFEKAPDRFCKLAQRFPHLIFHIFGDGEMKSELEKSRRENIIFHGYQKEAQNIWQNIDLLCIPSRKEGLPMAALEAMSHGIPVLSTPVGAMPELIKTDENGWIAEADHFESILQRILSHDVSKISQSAYKTIETQYSTQKLIPQFIQYYEEVIDARHRQSTPKYSYI